MATRQAAIAGHTRWAALDATCQALATPRDLKLLLGGSLLAACAYCAWMFDPGFLLGDSAYWTNPRSVTGASSADISTALSGYLFFQRDVWQLPLFHVSKLGAPLGMNIIFTDSIPWVALAGRLVFQITGVPVNLYGAWTGLCFAASAMSMTALVAALGQRSLAAAAMATVAGLCMPALLIRWGHMSLMAQSELTLALIFYLHNRRSGRAGRLFTQAAGLMLLALWTHSYLFAMVAPIVLATIMQAASGRALRWPAAIAILGGLAIVCSGVILLSGHLHSRGDLGTGASSVFFTMNLLSPILPQRSGLIPSFRDIIADGTGSQYEGFSYLGGGMLLLLVATIVPQMRTLWRGLRHHPFLFVLCIGFTLFALSNVIYSGPVRLADFPLPASILQFASMFRATGRFFWPVMYGITALAIAAVVPHYGRRGVLLLGAAAVLQWIDAAPLRQALAASTQAPAPPHIALAAWQDAMVRHRSIRVLPQFFCLGPATAWDSEVEIQLQLLAGVAGRPINTVYAARFAADCAAGQQIDGTPRPGARELSVFLSGFSGFAPMQALAASGGACRAGPGIVVCSDIDGEAPALAVLARTDRQ